MSSVVEDEDDVFKVLDEDNDSYLTEIPISHNWFGVKARDCSEVNYSRSEENCAAKNFGSLYAEVQSRYNAYKTSLESEKKSEDFASEERSAIVIQDYWRRYVDRRVFRRLRDLLIEYSGSDSSTILKLVNPREASLMDRASGTFIRFRFSGETFPPIIVYKIYTNRPIADFCRRNFSPHILADIKSCEKKTPRTKARNFLKPRIHSPGAKAAEALGKESSKNDSKIYDGNDWRPFMDSLTAEKPQTLESQVTTNKTLLTGAKAMRKRRLKLELIKRLYENGRRNELSERDKGGD